MRKPDPRQPDLFAEIDREKAEAWKAEWAAREKPPEPVVAPVQVQPPAPKTKKAAKAKAEKIAPPPAREETVDPMAAKLLAAGMATSYCLSLNRCLTATSDTLTEWPWYLPSRLFKFPVRFVACDRWHKETEYSVVHEDLLRHPFVRRIAGVLDSLPQVSTEGLGMDPRWHHAVDLMTEAHWEDLLKTRQLTTDDAIDNAVQFALDCPASYEGKGRSKGKISLDTARAVMAALGVPEPEDRSASVLTTNDGMYPADVGHWAPNLRGGGWASIHAIEDGWVQRMRQGHLEVTPEGLRRRGLFKDEPVATPKRSVLRADQQAIVTRAKATVKRARATKKAA